MTEKKVTKCRRMLIRRDFLSFHNEIIDIIDQIRLSNDEGQKFLLL